MIRLDRTTKIFNAGRPDEFAALVNFSCELNAHETTVFKGPSGSGKTTILSLIGCMVRPTAGRIFVEDREITGLPERFLSIVRRETFGFIFQRFNLLRGFTALENVIVPAFPSGEKRSSLVRRARDILAMLDMEQKCDAQAQWLSGGEAQRIAIARALINNPAVIIADEPTAHLDAGLSKDFLDIMAILKKEGKTVILASHDPAVFESPLVDRIVEIRSGDSGAPARQP